MAGERIIRGRPGARSRSVNAIARESSVRSTLRANLLLADGRVARCPISVVKRCGPEIKSRRMASSVLEHAWMEQLAWSGVANRLKTSLNRKRLLVLSLGVLAAVASAAAVIAGLRSTSGRLFAFIGAAAVAGTGVTQTQIREHDVRDWIRARWASEVIKSEVYLYLAGVGQEWPGRDARFDERVSQLEDEVSDLQRFRTEVAFAGPPLPVIENLDDGRTSYWEARVDDYISYYHASSVGLRQTVAVARRAQLALATIGALLGAAASTWRRESFAVWVPVVTTIGAAIAAHMAVARNEDLVGQYLATADQLRRVREGRGPAARLTEHERIIRAEEIISAQTLGWMAKVSSPDGAKENATFR
jgi:hypothetical protein